MVGLLRYSRRKRGTNGLARPAATALRLDSTEVGGLDTDTPIQAEATAVIQSEHVLGFVRVQQPVATGMPQDPGVDRVHEESLSTTR